MPRIKYPSTCWMIGCDGTPFARGYCAPHYHHAYYKRAILARAPRERPFDPVASLRARLKNRTTPPDAAGCVRWTGTHHGTGKKNGVVSFGGRTMDIRQAVVEAEFGTLDARARVRSTCGTLDCVNVDHMKIVARKQA